MNRLLRVAFKGQVHSGIVELPVTQFSISNCEGRVSDRRGIAARRKKQNDDRTQDASDE